MTDNWDRKCVTFNRTVGYVIVLVLFVGWLVHDLININSSIGGNIFLSLLLSNVGYSAMLVMPRFVIGDRKNLVLFLSNGNLKLTK